MLTKLTLYIMLSSGGHLPIPMERTYDNLNACTGDALYRVHKAKEMFYTEKNIRVEYICEVQNDN